MKRAIQTAFGVMALVVFLMPVAYGADVDAGKKLADNTCQACHGKDGIGITDMYPDLAGQKAAYTAAQLKAFRDGSRKDPIMNAMAKPLSNVDIANLSAYYSSLGRP